MNKKMILFIFIVGFLLNLIGAFFKITKWQSGNWYLLSGLVLQSVAIVFFLHRLYIGQKDKK